MRPKMDLHVNGLLGQKTRNTLPVFLLIGVVAILTIADKGLSAMPDDVQVYEGVVASSPGTVEAMNAQKELVSLYLKQGRAVEAKAAAAALVEGYTELTGRAGSIQQAGEAFRYAGEPEAMAQMHAYVAQQWPGSNEGMWSKRTVVLAELLAGQPEQADTTFNQLITDYSEAAQLQEAIFWLGYDCLFEVNDYDRALVYYDYVRTHWPEHEYALKAYAGQAVAYLNQGQEEQVQECLDTIRTEYVGCEGAANRMSWIAEGYEKLKNCSRAREVYQLTADIWASEKTEVILQARQQVGVLSVQLKDYETAEGVTAKLKEDYSGQLELAVALRAIAHAWEEQDEESRSQKIHEYVVQQWPGSNEAMWSQRSVVLSKVKTGAPDMDQAIQSFLTEYAGQEKLAEAVYWLGYNCLHEVKDPNQAEKCFRYVAENFGESRYGILSHQGLALLSIRQGDWARAAEETNMFLASDVCEGKAQAAVRLALEYEEREEAKTIYQYVVDHCSGDPYILWAQMGLAFLEVDCSESEGVAKLRERLGPERNHRKAPEVLSHMMAEKFNRLLKIKSPEIDPVWMERGLWRVLRGYELIGQDYSQTEWVGNAWNMAGACCWKLERLEESLAYYQLAADNADYEYNWSARFLVGRVYEEMPKQGLLSLGEAESKTRQTYQIIVDNYPDSPAAKAAKKWLNTHVEVQIVK